MGKIFLLLAAGWLLLLSQPAYAGVCQWTVQGNVEVLDDLFSDGLTLPLAGAKVKVWASVLESGGWALWGSDTIKQNGKYRVLAVPALSGPIWCDARRRFKVTVIFKNTDVGVVSRFGTAQKHVISDKNAWHSGRTVDINYTFKILTDKKRKQLEGRYVATRAAQFFLGFKKIHAFLSQNHLKPDPFRVVWPSEAGSKLAPRMWSPPLGVILIPKSEFWYLNKDTDKWSFTGGNLTKAKDILHESLHQWFHKHVYVPNYFSGATLRTHDFLETPELSFYEAIPEVLAKALDQDIFDSPGIGLSVPSRFLAIKNAFATAENESSGEKHFTEDELNELIMENGPQWKKYLARAEFTVNNTLLFLIRPKWHNFNPNWGMLSGYEGLSSSSLPYYFDCTEVPEQNFTPVEILQALKSWKSAWGGTIPVHKRDIREFMDWLTVANPDFSSWKNLIFKLGNPHYNNKIWGWDACHAEPLPVPQNSDLPNVLIP